MRRPTRRPTACRRATTTPAPRCIDSARISDAVRVARFADGGSHAVTVWTDFLGRGSSTIGRSVTFHDEREARDADAAAAERAKGIAR